MTTIELLRRIDATLEAVDTPVEAEFRGWLERGHSRLVSAYAVYMAHINLPKSWLEAHS